MWNPAPDYGHFHFPALWPTLFHCPGSKGDCYVLFKEGSGFEVGQVNHKQTRHVSVRIKSGCFHCTLWLRGYYCPLVTQSERTTTTTAYLVQSARASASRPSVLVCRAVWGHPSWSQTVHTPREKKNNNPTLLLIDCLAQERRLCGSSNPANSSHNSDTFSKVNSLWKCDSPAGPSDTEQLHTDGCLVRFGTLVSKSWSGRSWSVQRLQELPYSQYQVTCSQLPA